MLVSLPDAYAALNRARQGKSALREAEDLLRSRDLDAARRRLSDAQSLFDAAGASLDSALVQPATFVPLARRHIVTGRALAAAGEDLARAGITAADAARDSVADLHVVHGTLDLQALRSSGGALRRSLPVLTRARRTLEASPSRWLLNVVASEREEALRRASATEQAAIRATAGLEAASALLGEGGTKRYFLAFGNLAELRGTGGLIGYYSVLEARNGKLSFPKISGRPQSFPPPGNGNSAAPEWLRSAYGRHGALATWVNINMPSDFPSVARLMIATLPSAIGRVDGVVQLDPQALSSLLGLTGPVTVARWPEPLTADNVARVTQHEAYVRFASDNEARVAFLGDVVDAVFARLLGADVGLSDSSLSTLGSLVSSGHVQIYSTDDAAQRALSLLGLAGDVARAKDATDVLGVVGNNAVGNKIDWFLRREVHYRVRLNPTSGTARGDLLLELNNDSPPSGLPDYVIGSLSRRASTGTNRDLVVLVRPLGDEVVETRTDAGVVQFSRDSEAGLVGYHRAFNVPPQGSTAIEGTFVAPGAFHGSGRDRVYRLHILRQPVAHPDRYEVRIEVPFGWSAEGRTTFSGPLTADEVLEVRLHQSFAAWLADVAVVRPFRLARHLVTQLF